MGQHCEHGYFKGLRCPECAEIERSKQSETNLNLENSSLRAAIYAYGQHAYECASHSSRDGKWLECDCGWAECEWNPENA